MPDEPIDRHTFHDYIGIMESTVTTKNMISIPVSISRHSNQAGVEARLALSERSDELLVKVIPTEPSRRAGSSARDRSRESGTTWSRS